MLSEGQQRVENYHVERPVTADNGVSTHYTFIGECSWVSFNFFNLISFIPFSCIYGETLLFHTYLYSYIHIMLSIEPKFSQADSRMWNK
jgi:hypothetical protein